MQKQVRCFSHTCEVNWLKENKRRSDSVAVLFRSDLPGSFHSLVKISDDLLTITETLR